MKESEQDRLKRAWTFAHKLMTLAMRVEPVEGKDLLEVKTEDVCKAMGIHGKARLEEVQRFVRNTVSFMQGFDLHIVCGCGYLSLMVSSSTSIEQAMADNRELSSFTTDDLDAYFETSLREIAKAPASPVRQVCDIEDSNGKSRY